MLVDSDRFLVVHNYNYEAPGTPSLPDRLNTQKKTPPSFLPNLKAVVGLSYEPLVAMTMGGVSINLSNKYRYGSTDLFDLVLTVKEYHQYGDFMVQGALRKTISIYPHPNAQPDGQLKYQNRWQYTPEMDKEFRKIVKTVRVPYISIMDTDETKADPTGGKIPDPILDAAYWESRDGGSNDWEYRNAVTLRDLTPQAMLLNAKAVRVRVDLSLFRSLSYLSSHFRPSTPPNSRPH